MTNGDENEGSSRSLHPQPLAGTVGIEDISLHDLGEILRRRRWVLGIATIGIIAAFIAYAVMRDPKYRLTTIVEIGRVVEDGKAVPVEPATAVLLRAREIYLPTATNNATISPKIDQLERVAFTPNDAVGTLTVSVVTTQRMRNSYSEILKDIATSIADGHAAQIAIARYSLERQIAAARGKLEVTNLNMTSLEQRLADISSYKAMIEDQISRLGDELKILENQRGAVLKKVGSALTLEGLALINQGIFTLLERIEELEIRNANAGASEETQLLADLAEKKQARQIQTLQVLDLERQLEMFQETAVIVGPERYSKRLGPDTSFFFLLGIVLGPLFGFVAALAVELLGRAHRHIGPKVRRGRC